MYITFYLLYIDIFMKKREMLCSLCYIMDILHICIYRGVCA